MLHGAAFFVYVSKRCKISSLMYFLWLAGRAWITRWAWISGSVRTSGTPWSQWTFWKRWCCCKYPLHHLLNSYQKYLFLCMISKPIIMCVLLTTHDHTFVNSRFNIINCLIKIDREIFLVKLVLQCFRSNWGKLNTNSIIMLYCWFKIQAPLLFS